MKRFDYSPLYRKVIFPWYNTETIYYTLLGFMCLIFLFAAAGVSVARENPGFHEYVWLPLLLMGMSAMIIIAVIIRLTTRYIYKFKNRYLKENFEQGIQSHRDPSI